MTLVLTLGNRDQVVQISDRRLSTNGKPIDDESGKTGVLFCPNARLAFGYTGIARFKSFDTFSWLLQALHDSAPPSFIAQDIIETLKVRATQTFATHPALVPAPRSVKALSVLFSGYIYGTGYPKQGYALLSNYVNLRTGHRYSEPQDEFETRFFSETDASDNPTMIERIGNWHGIADADMYELRQLISERKPREAIVGVAVDLLRKIADRPKSANCIGKQLTTICISPDITEPVETAYHSNVVRRPTYMPAHVFLFPDNHATVSNISVVPVEPDTMPMSVPKVNKNAACPCGSRVRYKKCHGKKIKQGAR